MARSFLDYRIPVYKALDDLSNHQLTLIFNEDKVPERCVLAIKEILGERAIALTGEKRFASKKATDDQMANTGMSLPYHKDLIKTIRRTNPDVIVSDGYLKWTYASLWVRMFNSKGIKHIMCYERTLHTERNAGMIRTLYRKIAGCFIDAIDCNGSLTEEYVRKKLNYKKLLTFGHMAADTNGIVKNVQNTTQLQLDTIRNKYELNSLTFIYVGRLISLKGIIELLRAWLVADLKDATLMLVGDGKQREEIQDFVNIHNITNVKIVGAVNYDELGPYYKVADCFIIPTLEDNWSLVVPEAMAAGLPIACSIYNGCYPELVKPENGWTFDPLNIDDTVKTLKAIYASRDNLKLMGEESRKIVSNHTPQHAAQGIYEACLKVIQK